MYNNYFPNFNNNQNIQQGGLKWVQGEAGVKAQYVAPGCVAVFFDTERPVFYIKSVDMSGMPQPLKIYDFSERKQVEEDKTPFDLSQYVRKDELEDYIKKIVGGGKDEKSPV